jgi:hypothetical protein
MRQLVIGMIANAAMFTAFAVDAGGAAQAQRARYCAHYDFSTSNCVLYRGSVPRHNQRCRRLLHARPQWAGRLWLGPRQRHPGSAAALSPLPRA